MKMNKAKDYYIKLAEENKLEKPEGSKGEELPEAIKPEFDPKFCKYCGEQIIGRSSCAEYCCPDCQKKAEREKYLKLNPKRGEFSCGVAGGINETRACTDLLQKGYEVFRSVCQCCSCDLIAMKNGKMYRVEVTSGSYCGNGNVNCGMHNPDNYDIIMAVTFDKIFYKNGKGNEIEV